MAVKIMKDVAYGPDERNTLDAYIINNNDAPTPMLIYFHGGGYVSGDKASFVDEPLMQECLDANISVVTCHYRFITTDPYPAPMDDGTRAIQFVRNKATEWGIDPEKIASAGSSAGGHIALWNALRGDLSKPKSADPIERTASHVCAFIGFGTQISKDQRFYDHIYDGPHVQPNLPLFYGVKTMGEVYEPAILERAEEASAINYMSAHAPPVFMDYVFELTGTHIPTDAPVGEVIHHPIHGYMLQKEYDTYGVPFELRHKGNPTKQGEMIQFLLDSFKQSSKK